MHCFFRNHILRSEDDGIQPLYTDPLKGSALRLPRMAPENNYEKELVQHKYVRRQGRYLETRRDENWFFRVRTEKDQEGNVVSALYGKIQGPYDGVGKAAWFFRIT